MEMKLICTGFLKGKRFLWMTDDGLKGFGVLCVNDMVHGANGSGLGMTNQAEHLFI